MTAQAHADFVARVPGFEVVGACLGGHEAIERFDELAAVGAPVDIVLLDMNLTDSHGLEVAGRLNSRGQDVDIIAITAVRHLQVIRSAISDRKSTRLNSSHVSISYAVFCLKKKKKKNIQKKKRNDTK